MREEQDTNTQGRSTDQETKDGMPDWKNVPKLDDLRADLTEAQSAHDMHVAQVQAWLNALEGKQRIAAKPGRSKIVPKLIRKQAEWRYSALSEPFLSTEDLFDSEPHTFEDKEAAFQNGIVLNFQVNKQIDKVKFIDEYVRTAVDEGTVVVKVGWDTEEEEVIVDVPVMKPVPVQDPAKAQEMMMQGQPAIEYVQVGTRQEEQTVVTKNQPTLEVCDYRNVIIDPTCEGDLDKANFVIFSFETSLSDLKKDGRYFGLDDIQPEDQNPLNAPDHEVADESQFEFKDEPRKKMVAYEYWGYWDIDGKGKTKPIVCTWIGKTIIRMEENPFPDKKVPFVLVQYLPKRKKNYGEPDGVLIEDNQKVIGAVTRGMIDVMGRSANGQMGTRKDALDVVNARKFERGEDFKFNANVDPRQAFHMETYPEVPRSALEMIQIQNNEAESLTGIKAFSQGINSNSLGKVAAGIRSAMDATAKRELNILRRLANGVIKIGRKIVSMNSEFLEDEEIFRITNEEFLQIKREALAGEFDIRLNVSTAESDNEKASELAFMLQTIGNTMPPEFSQLLLADIAKLRKMPELAKKIQEFKPEPDPLVEKEKQLNIDLLEAQVENERAKARENQVDVELKAAKAENERAKARATHSDADNKDLDFINKESGVEDANKNQQLDMQHQHEKELKGLDLIGQQLQQTNNVAPAGQRR